MTEYETNRRNTIASIFQQNIDLWKEVDPYAYDRDVYEELSDELYTLTVGGHEARKHCHKAITDLIETMIEFTGDDKVPDLCEELIDSYKDYEDNYLFMTA